MTLLKSLLLLSTLVASGLVRQTLPTLRERSNPSSNAPLQVSGSSIVNSDGDVVQLRGFQGLGFYPIEFDLYMTALHEKNISPEQLDVVARDISNYTLTPFDIAEIKRTGANVVRIWFNVDEIDKGTGSPSSEVLDMMEQVINEFGANDIYVIPVLGCAGQHDFECNEWYTQRGLSLWDTKTDLWERSIAVWEVVAERFKDNQYIAGYDLINEPKAPSRAALREYYLDGIKAIRKHDSNRIIFLESDVAKPVEHQLGGRYDDPNIAASFHFYFPRDLTLNEDMPNVPYPGTYCAIEKPGCTPVQWGKEELQTRLDYALSLDDIVGLPVFIGEFGATGLHDPGASVWIEDMLQLMNERGISYTYHNYRHRKFHGYWIITEAALSKRRALIESVVTGTLPYSEITTQQKKVFSTEGNYSRRSGMQTLLQRYFTN